MSGLSESAKLVKEALEQRGLETPMRPNAVSREEKKEKIEHHMREILTLLQLDLTDDSLEETPHRIAKMYVDEIFSGLDYSNFPKITVIENKMNVSEMVRVKDITVTSTCETTILSRSTAKRPLRISLVVKSLVSLRSTALSVSSRNVLKFKSV